MWSVVVLYTIIAKSYQASLMTINTGSGVPGPEDRGPNELALLHLAFVTEMQLVSMFSVFACVIAVVDLDLETISPSAGVSGCMSAVVDL